MKSRKRRIYFPCILALTLITILLFLPPGRLFKNKSKESSDKTATQEKPVQGFENSKAIESIDRDVLAVANPTESGNTDFGYNSTFDEEIVSYISPFVYVYDTPSDEGTAVGVLEPMTSARIVSKGSEWTKVSLGETTGFVKNTSVLFGYEAETVAREYGVTLGYIVGGETAVYDIAGSDAQILGHIPDGANIFCVGYDENYTRVSYEELEGFVKNDHIRYEYSLARGLTMEEYEARELAKEQAEREEAERLEAERRAEEEREQELVKQGLERYIPVEQREAVSLSDEDIWLLACIVKYESGWQPYEGKLAVANVVLNRMKKSGLSMSDVIYAPYQFSGVANLDGTPSDYFYDNYLTKELPYRLTEANAEECMRAALEAASGVNNIGDFRYFIGTAYADYGSYSDYKTIAGHVFYSY